MHPHPSYSPEAVLYFDTLSRLWRDHGIVSAMEEAAAVVPPGSPLLPLVQAAVKSVAADLLIREAFSKAGFPDHIVNAIGAGNASSSGYLTSALTGSAKGIADYIRLSIMDAHRKALETRAN